MADPIPRVLAGIAAGMALGVFMYGGLFVTIRRIPNSNRPTLLVLFSLFLRLGVFAALLSLVAWWGGWMTVVAAVPGLAAARVMVLRLTAKGGEHG